jgi:hypothetical protein
MSDYTEYNDLSVPEKKEANELVEGEMKPMVEKGFVEKTNYNGRTIWASHVNPQKLAQAVVKGLANKGKEMGTITIAGKEVLLTFVFTMIMNLKDHDEQKELEIDEYIKNLK